VLDDQFNVDFAHVACRDLPGCVDGLGVEAQVRDFELQLSTAFATDSSCNGLVLVSYPAKPTLEDLKASWLLTLQFNPGQPGYGWRMGHGGATGHPRGFTEGEGNATAIAHAVCAVVKQRGGSVVN